MFAALSQRLVAPVLQSTNTEAAHRFGVRALFLGFFYRLT